MVNLCDGFADENKAGAEVIEALEKFNIPYTGSSKYQDGITKKDMKYLFYRGRVPQPSYIFAYGD